MEIAQRRVEVEPDRKAERSWQLKNTVERALVRMPRLKNVTRTNVHPKLVNVKQMFKFFRYCMSLRETITIYYYSYYIQLSIPSIIRTY